jgi:hypothetical protein
MGEFPGGRLDLLIALGYLHRKADGPTMLLDGSL